MRLSARLVLTAFAVLVAACGGTGAASPSSPPAASPSVPPSPAEPTSAPAASPSVPPSPAEPTPDPSADPAAQTYWLRAMTTQALPPLNVFGMQPYSVITGDGQWIARLALPTVYPGPLLPSLQARQVTEAGRTAILQAARDLGLLEGTTDFNVGPVLAGGVSGRIEMTVDGQRVTLTGNPNALMECVTTPCEPPPGSAAAFAEFWRRLGDPGSWIPNEMGPASAYVAPAYAILVGPAPTPDPNFTQAPMDWPLEQPLALFGGPVADGSYRCGTVSGADADTLRPSLQAANQLTPWVQDPATSATFGLTVRPMVPGEDVCRETFGPA